MAEGFKKPFKAVPLNPPPHKRLKGLDELEAPRWSPLKQAEPVNWTLVALGLSIGVSLGLAYLLFSAA